MAIAPQLRRQIEAGNFAAVEDAWLRGLEEAADAAYFVGLSRALAGAGEEERARPLLELLDEQLQAGEHWEERLRVLLRAGQLLYEPVALHGEVVATLRNLYPDSPSLEGLMEKVGLQRAVEDFEKNRRKVRRLRALLEFDRGAVVWMDGKGAGRVVEVNLQLDNFKIDFDRHPGLRVGFRAASKLLRALPPGHLLRRKVEEPEALRALAEQDPGALLVALLESQEEPLTAAQIRRALEDVVGADRWSAWWAAARRHPQIVSLNRRGQQLYTGTASGRAAREAVLEAFAGAGVEGKLALWRRNVGRWEDLDQQLAAELARVGEEAAAERPGEALAIWLALERAGRAPAAAGWSADAQLAAAPDPASLAATLADRPAREEAYRRLRAGREQDWPEVYARLLEREEDGRLLDALADGLRKARPELLEAFLDRLLAQPRRQPAAFAWLAERAAQPVAAGRNPLRLLQQILEAPRHPELASYRARLARLLESGGPLVHLLERFDEAQAAQAEKAIERAPFEDYLRQPLLNALHLRFPALRPEATVPLYALPSSIATRRAELEKLKLTEIPANRKAIEEARALGDLRENFEYKAARQRHEYLNARLQKLQRDLERVRPLAAPAEAPAEVRPGCRVRLADADGTERTLALLGPWESDPARGVISYEAELGRELAGKRPGDTVALDGRDYRIEAVEPAPEAAAGASTGGAKKVS